MMRATTMGAMLTALVLSTSVHAAIGTWSNDSSKIVSGTTVTGSGSSATWSGPTVANAAVIAPIDPITLTPGTFIDLHGTMAIPSTTPGLGNVQLRFGLFNVFANNPLTTATGWTGYMPEIPNSGGGLIRGDDASTNQAWANSAAGPAVTITNSGNAANPTGAGTPFTFDLMITETAVGTNAVSASFISADGTTYVWGATGTDTGTAAAANTTYNELGFFDGGTGMGTNPTVTFSNVAVTTGTAAPEPASLGIAAVGTLALMARRRR